MIGLRVKLNKEGRLLARQAPDVMVPAIYRAMKKAMMLVEARVKGHYLTGAALRVRTGHLRRSIHSDAEIRGDKVRGSIGTNVVYGRFWELGYKGPMEVREHWRTITKAFGRPIAPRSVLVRGHTRQVDVEARPFLRPAILDKLEEIKRIIAREIEKDLR